MKTQRRNQFLVLGANQPIGQWGPLASLNKVGEPAARDSRRPVRRSISTAVALAAALAVGASIQAAAPIVPTAIEHGAATFATHGPLTTITAANQTIIDYSRFNIPNGDTVRFVQPGASATVLNRINSAVPSQIDGNLFGNGIVYLVNPAGVMFGADAVVDVGQLYAAASHITNQNFLSGVNQFTGGNGLVDNQGIIQASAVNLIGQQVGNEGTILAPRGMVALAAGKDVYVGRQDGSVYVQLKDTRTPAAARKSGIGVSNTGTINADGGSVSLTAGDIYSIAARQSGTITAGNITVKSGKNATVLVSGKLDASNQGPNSQSGTGVSPVIGTTGGTIAINAGQIGIGVSQDANGNFTYLGTNIDASGKNGGGKILIGVKPDAHSATGYADAANYDFISANSTLNADATVNGNGGLVDTSGANLQVNPRATITAAGAVGGNAGEWLLDPVDVAVVASPPTSGTPLPSTGSATPRGQITYAPSNGLFGFLATSGETYLTAGTIASELDGGTSVVVESSPPGTTLNLYVDGLDLGNIDVYAPISAELSNGGQPTPTLAFYADGSLTVHSGGSITATGGPLDINLVAGSTFDGGYDGQPISLTIDAPITSDGGYIMLSSEPSNSGLFLNLQSSAITINQGAAIDSSAPGKIGGSVTILNQLSPLGTGPGAATGSSSINLYAPITTGGGSVTVQSAVTATSVSPDYVDEAASEVYLGSTISTGGGAVDVQSTASSEAAFAFSSASSTIIQADTSTISAGSGDISLSSKSSEQAASQSLASLLAGGVDQLALQSIPIPLVGALATSGLQSSISGIDIGGSNATSGSFQAQSNAQLTLVGTNGICIGNLTAGANAVAGTSASAGLGVSPPGIGLEAVATITKGQPLMNPAISVAATALGALRGGISSASDAIANSAGNVGEAAAENFLLDQAIGKLVTSATHALTNTGIAANASLALGQAGESPTIIAPGDAIEAYSSAAVPSGSGGYSASSTEIGSSLDGDSAYFSGNGKVVFDGGGVNTMGNGQNYSGPVFLAAPTTLSDNGDGNIWFSSTVSNATSNPEPLTINGGVPSFEGEVGAAGYGGLASLDVTGKASVGSFGTGNTSIRTVGNQIYSTLLLAGNTSLTSSGGGDISVLGDIDALTGTDSSLAISTDGKVYFAGLIGSQNPPTGLTVTSATEINFIGLKSSVTLKDGAEPSFDVTPTYGYLGVVPGSGSDGSTPSLNQQLTLPAAFEWDSSGATVQSGQTVTISASGQVYIGDVSLGMPSVSNYQTPAGDPNLSTANLGGGTFAAPGLVPWSLVGRIGQNGTPFEIGTGIIFTAAASGKLYLSVNDNVFGDDSGTWAINIQAGESSGSGGSAAAKPVIFMSLPSISAQPPSGVSSSPTIINASAVFTGIDTTGATSSNASGNSRSNGATATDSTTITVPSSLFPSPTRAATPVSNSTNAQPTATTTGDGFFQVLYPGSDNNSKPPFASPLTTSSIVTNGSDLWTAPTSSITKNTNANNNGGIGTAISSFFGNAAKTISNFFGSWL